MADQGTKKAREEWAGDACHLFTMNMKAPLGFDLAVINTGRDLPDIDLEKLCDAIMRDVNRPVRSRGDGCVTDDRACPATSSRRTARHAADARQADLSAHPQQGQALRRANAMEV